MIDTSELGRLAFRQEGDWWNAYWAKTETMEGAIHLGSIRMSLVTTDETRKAFKDTMRLTLGVLISDTQGAEAEWTGERPAPENERAGSA